VRLTMIRSWAVFFALVSAMVVSMHCIALAEIKEEARWSIDFGEISISEALDQLTKVTGIKIFTKTPLSHRISPKRYRNQSIEQILKDLLKNVNFAAVWHYSERGIESIGILAFDRARAESNSIVSNVKRVGMTRRPLPRGAGPTRLPPSGQVSGLERGEGIKEPSAEPEETEGSEADDRDEELGKSSKEDTSSPDSSDAQLEPTTGSSRGEEGLPKDQQNEGKE
jgi:hypothetical protein